MAVKLTQDEIQILFEHIEKPIQTWYEEKVLFHEKICDQLVAKEVMKKTEHGYQVTELGQTCYTIVRKRRIAYLNSDQCLIDYCLKLAEKDS